MKKKFILILLITIYIITFILCSKCSFAADERTPLIVLTENNPWLSVIGADTPTFSLYSDGLMIYFQDKNFQSVRLTAKELTDFTNQPPIKEFQTSLYNDYEVSDFTDQPTNIIYIWDKKKNNSKRVIVYGDIRSDKNDIEKTPQVFIEIFNKLISYNNPKAKKWFPDYFEIMIWPFDDAGEYAVWPKDWPGLKNPTTKKRNESYSIYLKKGLYDKFLDLVKDKNAIKLGDKTWAYSVRMPFPCEEYWMKYKP